MCGSCCGFSLWLLAALTLLRQAPTSYCLTNGDLRLNGIGSSGLVGRLEVFYNDRWGTVCGGRENLISNFNDDTAQVACRQMGLGFAVDYYSLQHLPEHRLQYGIGSGPIFLGSVSCQDHTEMQSHLLQCTFGVINNTQLTVGCDHSTDVILQCSNISSPYNGEIRLTPDPATPPSNHFPSSGIVELFSNDQWKKVCMDNVPDPATTATVLCRQLGYTNGTIEQSSSSVVLRGEEVWDLDGPLSCSTGEMCIASCLRTTSSLPLPTTTRSTSCQGRTLSCNFQISTPDNVHVDNSIFGNRNKCARSTTPPINGAVQLAPPNEFLQRLEIAVGRAWGTICSLGFSPMEANVVCRDLGYPSALPHSDVSDVVYDVPRGSGRVYDLRCSGLEDRVTDCTISSSTSPNCTSHARDVIISCSGIRGPYGSLALRGPVNHVAGASGTLFLYNGSVFYPVCDSDFGISKAQVACRQLGYKGGVAINNSYFEMSQSSNALVRLSGSCSGSESELLSCSRLISMETDQSSDCRPRFDEVAVQCLSNDIELQLVDDASSTNTSAGRLEVKFNGVWGRVCGAGFGRSEALVVCKNLGYQSVISFHIDASNGVGSGPIHLTNLTCSGIELSLLHCSFSLEGCISPQNVDISIECGSSPLPSNGDLRLVDGETTATNQSGRLEVSLNGEWQSVCGTLFSPEAAGVACRQLGYTSASHYCNDSCFGEGSGEVYFVESRCSGDEERLLDCPRGRRHHRACNHSRDVGLLCVDRFHVTSSLIPAPPEGLVTTPPPKPPSKKPPLFVYYIIAGGVALILLVVLTVICCVCCYVRRKRSKREGTWTSSYHMRNSRGQNHHHHHNGVVGDISKITQEKEGGFDDPKDKMEMHNSPTQSPYDHSPLSPHHDVILHALNHSHEREDSYIAPKTKVKGRHSKGNGYHVQHIGNGSATSSSTSNGFGMGHRTPTSDIPTCPPPDYNELFQSEAGAVPVSRVNDYHGDSREWYKGDDSENEKNRTLV